MLQFRMAVEGLGQQFLGSDEDVEGLFKQGDGGVVFDSMMREWGFWGYEGEARTRWSSICVAGHESRMGAEFNPFISIYPALQRYVCIYLIINLNLNSGSS